MASTGPSLPMVDICRDPRWGRIAEGIGEDPYLGYQIAGAMVRGYQGNDLSLPNTVAACVKHYALYGASKPAAITTPPTWAASACTMIIFLPTKGAVDAGCASVMASFNEIEGVPATANKWLLTDVLRKQWGFNGMVVTDYTKSINEMIDHGIGDLQTVTARALNAGIDMDMVGEGMLTTLAKSQKKARWPKTNQRCVSSHPGNQIQAGPLWRSLPLLWRGQSQQRCILQRTQSRSQKTGSRNPCTIENNNNILPLQKKGTIALIGPLANNKVNMPGTWSVAAKHDQSISLLRRNERQWLAIK